MINIIRISLFRSFCVRAYRKLKYIWNVKKTRQNGWQRSSKEARVNATSGVQLLFGLVCMNRANLRYITAVHCTIVLFHLQGAWPVTIFPIASTLFQLHLVTNIINKRSKSNEECLQRCERPGAAAMYFYQFRASDFLAF